MNTQFSKNSNGLRLKNDLYKSCRSQPDLQLCSWKFFQLRLFWHPNIWFKILISKFLNFQMTSDGKKVYMKVAGRDHIYNFVIEKIFIWHRYSCEMGYIRHLKVMIKGKNISLLVTCDGVVQWQGRVHARLRLWV